MERIGRYEVVERLGSGGFATVYLVRDPVLDSEVAAKVLAENWSDKTDLRERFVREAQLLRRIDSDRVVTVHDIGELPSGQPYFVMALVDRGTLDDRLASMPPPAPPDVRNVGNQLAECLRTIHGHDMIHRDIKPSNLLIAGPRTSVGQSTESGLLGPSERLVLGDFGLAKDIALQSTVGFTISAGTGGYAAPEQMSPVGVPDRQTDLYAATGVMYRAITAETPPAFDLASQTVPFPDHEPWMAGELGQFFRHGMAFYPERRHPSVDAWAAGLEAAVQAMGNGAAPSTVWAPTSSADFASGPSAPSNEFRPETWQPPTSQPSVNPRPISQPSAPAPRHPSEQPIISGPNPVVQSGPQPMMPGSVGHPGTMAQPPSYQQPSYQQSAYQQPEPDPQVSHDSVTYAQVTSPRRVGRWVALVTLVAAAALAGLWFVLRPVGPTIDGPAQLQAGRQATYMASFDGAVAYEWTDWNNATQTTDGEFLVTAVAPGNLTFSVRGVQSDGSTSPSTSHTIDIVEADDGPVIVGQSAVSVGETATYTFTAPDGATNPIWIDDNAEQAGDTYTVTPSQAGTFRVILIVTLPDGRSVGTAKDLEFVG